MLRKMITTGLVWSLMLTAGAIAVSSQSIAPVQDNDNYDLAKIDRYLDIEVWTGHSDGEYYEGDDVVIYFRANRDAFVALYSIDTRGRVNLLFPTHPGEDNFVAGGVTYSLPGADDDYDLIVSGPEGFEHVQVLASRERFPIPDWYQGPELVDDWEDRGEFMDWINANYFVRYHGQRFAYDRAVIYVNEWEENYFRPVYHPIYPSWTVYGNAYVDYPWGGSVYVNGVYWGSAPLYVPRIAVGWHTITVYDHYGHCWEHDFHVSRYNTVVFNQTIIKTSPGVRSKYKEVRAVGYRDPVRNGYPNYESRRKVMAATSSAKQTKVTRAGTSRMSSEPGAGTISKKYVRGSTKIVKTDRGYETDASTAVFPTKRKGRLGSTDRVSSSRKAITGGGKSKSGTSNSGRVGQTGSDRKSAKSSGSSSSFKRTSNSSSRSKTPTVTGRKSTGSTSPRKTSGSVGKSSKGKSSSRPAKVERRKTTATKAKAQPKATVKESKPAKKSNPKPVEKKSSSTAKKKSSSSKSKKDDKGKGR